MNPCPYCGDLMTNPRRKQCGTLDCKRRFNADRMRDYMRERRATDPEFAARHRAYERKAKQYAIVCDQCGEPAVVTKRTARHCSHECYYDAKFGAGRPRDSYAGGTSEHALASKRRATRKRKRIQNAQQRLARAEAGTRGSGVICAGRCVRCGETFARRCTTPTGHCSRRCWARDKNAARRALLRGQDDGTVSRWRIFERDGWACHICGDSVDREAVVPDLAAPTLDHVVPLARGGRHTEANVKTAHFYCNSVKRDLEEGWSALAA